MRRRAVLVLAVAVGSAVISAAPVGAADSVKTVTNDRYARSLCQGIGALNSAELAFTSRYNAFNPADPVGLQGAAVGAATEYLGATKTVAARLAKLRPTDAPRTTRLFRTYFEGRIAAVQGAIDQLRAADPTNPAFAGALTTFENELKAQSTQAPPVDAVTNAHLLDALKEQKACRGVVTIIGG